jgi:hypothetical protein
MIPDTHFILFKTYLERSIFLKPINERIMKKLIRLLILSVFLTSTMTVFAQTVYVNKADSKYHLLSCRYLDPSHDSLDMVFAIKKGLGPCTVCKPNVKGGASMGTSGSMGAPKTMEKSGMKQQMNSSTNVAGQQCAVINKDGKRCVGTAEPGSIYCWDHKDYKK